MSTTLNQIREELATGLIIKLVGVDGPGDHINVGEDFTARFRLENTTAVSYVHVGAELLPSRETHPIDDRGEPVDHVKIALGPLAAIGTRRRARSDARVQWSLPRIDNRYATYITDTYRAAGRALAANAISLHSRRTRRGFTVYDHQASVTDRSHWGEGSPVCEWT